MLLSVLFCFLFLFLTIFFSWFFLEFLRQQKMYLFMFWVCLFFLFVWMISFLFFLSLSLSFSLLWLWWWLCCFNVSEESVRVSVLCPPLAFSEFLSSLYKQFFCFYLNARVCVCVCVFFLTRELGFCIRCLFLLSFWGVADWRISKWITHVFVWFLPLFVYPRCLCELFKFVLLFTTCFPLRDAHIYCFFFVFFSIIVSNSFFGPREPLLFLAFIFFYFLSFFSLSLSLSLFLRSAIVSRGCAPCSAWSLSLSRHLTTFTQAGNV
ncbi:hypothetical protein ABB37_07759 [Leptomonas pyrrhocoris]|uniref:Uncharacterized protein n=1 Tax=Leptomonas pyrrhocoris TaxID=157538 RepID=A0A0N0DSU0_LEPPY|nr:hypothetical protein ABB37_07759 [Leptomonas pyrrhocoris]KPA76434.1 hypothetical protein ABB37_07759 [Leptomonas pyrrhocoris]|eukprot:XP_015654873.1 hypothetical protein ABB37_07759 [Leptomonas pyrrhocoris]